MERLGFTDELRHELGEIGKALRVAEAAGDAEGVATAHKRLALVQEDGDRLSRKWQAKVARQRAKYGEDFELRHLSPEERLRYICDRENRRWKADPVYGAKAQRIRPPGA